MAAAKSKEVIYTYKGINTKTKAVVEGELTGTSEAMVKAVLRRQGVIANKIKKKSKPLMGGGGKTITAGDIAIFARQLTTMMEAGVPLLQSFEIVGEGQENPRMQKLILEIKAHVESGGTLAEAFRQHPDQFDALFCNLVEAGEQAGILESLLNKVAIYKEKSEGIKKKIKGALTYPIAILVVAMVVSAILLIFVVPVFADMFKDFGGELPGMTAFVVKISDFMVANWLYVFGSIAAFVTVFKQLNKRSKKFNEMMQRASLKYPVFGQLIYLGAVARFARTLSTMFAAGTPLVESLDSVAGATGNIVFFEAVKGMQEEIATGTTLTQSMRNCKDLWPNMAIQMVQIGEESGALDKMLGKVADFYEEEVDAIVEKVSAMMEPMIMAFLGVVIGGLVLAMYMPIFKMGSVV